MKRARCSFSRIATSTLPTGERWKRQSSEGDDEADGGDDRSSRSTARSRFEAEHGRARDAAEAALAAGERGPAKRDREQHARSSASVSSEK